MSKTCEHVSCSDTTDNTVMMENGDEFYLCEDHAHMNPDGTPVEGYEANDPEKFVSSDASGD